MILQAMRASELAALACRTAPDILMLTGYWPVMGMSFAVLTAEDKLLCLVPEDELELAESSGCAEWIPYRPATTDSLRHPGKALEEAAAELRRRLPSDPARIGVIRSGSMAPVSYQATYHFRDVIDGLLAGLFPHSDMVDAGTTMHQLRSVLTEIERAKLVRCCERARSGFNEAAAAIAAGRREDEIAADIAAAHARVANDGFERGAGYFFCMSGSNAAKASGAYARTRRRVVETGDTVMIHANTVGDGFWTDITRTYVVGEPSAKQGRMREAIDEARAAALAVVRPGAQASEVDRAARDVLTKYGFGVEFKHAVGHGVGFAAADPNALPRLHPHSPDILQAGMTFNIEPAVYFDGEGGMRHCDVVLCTETGAQVLTPF